MKSNNKLKLISFFLMVVFLPIMATSVVPHEVLAYKQTLQGELSLHVFYPDGEKKGIGRPVIIHFFGGGWMEFLRLN